MSNRERLEAAGWTVAVSQEMDGHDFEIWFIERNDVGSYVRSDDDDAVTDFVNEPVEPSGIEYPAGVPNGEGTDG